MRPGEEHQAAKKALRRGNARRRCYDLLCEICSVSDLLGTGCDAGSSPAKMSVCLPERSMGRLLLSGGDAEVLPIDRYGGCATLCISWYFMYVAVFAKG
jgi:hypothetical protein